MILFYGCSPQAPTQSGHDQCCTLQCCYWDDWKIGYIQHNSTQYISNLQWLCHNLTPSEVKEHLCKIGQALSFSGHIYCRIYCIPRCYSWAHFTYPGWLVLWFLWHWLKMFLPVSLGPGYLLLLGLSFLIWRYEFHLHNSKGLFISKYSTRHYCKCFAHSNSFNSCNNILRQELFYKWED